MKKTTNNATVKAAIRAHIMDYFTIDELAETVRIVKCRTYPTVYHAVKHIVEAGGFLIYHAEVAQFLNSLGINPQNKEYDTAESWKLYCHLIARDSQLLLKSYNI